MLYIGPHVSIASSIALSPLRAREIGATGFALFVKNQRQWHSPPLKKEDIDGFIHNLKIYNYPPSSLLPHASYLINLASPSKEGREKSKKLLLEEGRRVLSLGLTTLNLHPGSFLEGEREEGIKRIGIALNDVLSKIEGLKIAIENTSGSGSTLGSSFQELCKIYGEVREKDRVGFTLDTAHLYGAGYDLNEKGDSILDEFFSLLGQDKLFGMHLNNSKVALNSKLDRHENLKLGLIKWDVFSHLVKREELQNIPLILETPNSSLWKEEVNELLGLN